MQKLLGLAFIGAFCLFTVRFVLGAISDLQLKNDVSAVPGSTASRENHAGDIALNIREVAQKHGCAVVDDGIEVDLAEVELRGTPPTTANWQWVTMRLTCVRPNAFFMKRPHTVEVKMEMMVPSGHAEHWPAR